MKSIPAFKHSLLAAVLVAASGIAGAADGIVSSAGITNIQFGVLDLTPADGNTPTFSVGRYYNNFAYALNEYSQIASPVRDYQFVQGLSAETISGTTGQSHVTLQTDGAVGGMRVDSTYLTDLAKDGVSTAAIGSSVYVTVSAHSALTVSGTAFSSLQWQVGSGVDGYGATDVSVGFWTGWDSGTVVEMRHGFGAWDHNNEQWSENFWLAYANETDSDVTLSLDFAVSTEGRIFSDVSPIPEPSTYAMLGAGLLLVGAAARRKARTAR